MTFKFSIPAQACRGISSAELFCSPLPHLFVFLHSSSTPSALQTTSLRTSCCKLWTDSQVSSAPVELTSYTQALSHQLSWSIHGKVKRCQRKWGIVSWLGESIEGRYVDVLVGVCPSTGVYSSCSWVWELRKADVLDKNRGWRNTEEVNFVLCMPGIKAANLNHVMILSDGVAVRHLQNELSLLWFSQDGCIMLQENGMLK